MPKKAKQKSKAKPKTARKVNKKKKKTKTKVGKKKSMTTVRAPVALGTSVKQKVGPGRRYTVSHREHLLRVQPMSPYGIYKFPIQAGLQATFPWLYAQAQGYEHYKFLSLQAEYVPSCSTNTAGRVMTTFVTDVTAVDFIDNDEQFAYSGTLVTQPWMNHRHSMPSAPVKQYLTRSSGVSGDLHLYDQCNFIVSAEVSNDSPPGPLGDPGEIINQIFGDVYLNYVVEFWVPKAPSTDAPATLGGWAVPYNQVTEDAPFGTAIATSAFPPVKSEEDKSANGIAFGRNITVGYTGSQTVFHLWLPEGQEYFSLDEVLRWTDQKDGGYGDLVSNLTNATTVTTDGADPFNNTTSSQNGSAPNYHHTLRTGTMMKVLDSTLPILLSYAATSIGLPPSSVFVNIAANYLSERVLNYLAEGTAPMIAPKKYWRDCLQRDPNEKVFYQYADNFYRQYKQTCGHATITTRRAVKRFCRPKKVHVERPISWNHLYQRRLDVDQKEERKESRKARLPSEESDLVIVPGPRVVEKPAGWLDSLSRSKSKDRS